MKFKMLTILCLGLLGLNLFADENQTLSYQGQENDRVALTVVRNLTKIRYEEKDSTCTGQRIKEYQKVCAPVTKYRQQCETIPGHQNCYQTNEEVCENVTRYRRECYNETRYRQECGYVTDYERVCTTVDGEIECHQENGRRVCRKVPRQECRNEPRQRYECRNVPYYETECRNVPYTDSVCHQERRNRCDWIPDQQSCQSIPYQETVCENKPVYENYNYACKETVAIPYKVDVTVAAANIEVNYQLPSELKANIKLALSETGDVTVKFLNQDRNDFIITHTTNLNKETRADKTFQVTGSIKIEGISQEQLLKAVQIQDSQVKIYKDRVEFTSQSSLQQTMLQSVTGDLLVKNLMFGETYKLKQKLSSRNKSANGMVIPLAKELNGIRRYETNLNFKFLIPGIILTPNVSPELTTNVQTYSKPQK